MKKNGYILKKFILCLLLYISVTLCACGKDSVEGYTVDQDEIYRDDFPTAIAIILGNHANAKTIPDDAYSYIEKSLDHVVYGGYACAIISDGTPTKIELANEDFYKEDARNPEILAQHVRERKIQMINEIRNLGSADAPEVDLLGAIREAKNALESTRTENINNKQMIIIDTGISTSGDLNLSEIDFLENRPDVETIVERLDNYDGVGVLPDLSGITVTFIGTYDGLAETASPQMEGTSDKKYIKSLWTSLVEACGAKNIQYVSAAGWNASNIYTEDANSEFPYVTVVNFYHESIFDFSDLPSFNPNDPDLQPDMPSPPKPEFKLASEMVGFYPDKADYYDENQAILVLKPYARDLIDYFSLYPDEQILVAGTTAAIPQGTNGSVELSLARAETVKATLISLGVPGDRLLTIGLGARFPWAVDEYATGEFDTFAAQDNRAVWLISKDEENEKFEMLKTAYEKGELLLGAMEGFANFIA